MLKAHLIPGWTDEPDLTWLRIEARKRSRVVEIGTWLGKSAAVMAEAAPRTLIVTVDTFLGSPSELRTNHREAVERDLYVEAVQNLAPYPNVVVMRCASIEAASLLSNVEMVFIDGEHTHTAVMSDLLAWYPKTTQLLCGHDRDVIGVAEALQDFGVPYKCGPGSLWYMER